MKKQLHIKYTGMAPTGDPHRFGVCYLDGKVWRSYGNHLTRDEANELAQKLIAKSPKEFHKDVCDCGTPTEDKGYRSFRIG